MKIEIIPNEEIKNWHNLPLWKQHLLATHFSPKRTDCVEMNYTYLWDNSGGKIYLKGATPEQDVDLTDELDNLDWMSLAKEYGLKVPVPFDFVKDYLITQTNLIV